MYKIFQKRASVLWISLAIFVIDQTTKYLITRSIALTNPPTVAFRLFGDFFQIIHVRNTGALFSLGAGLWGIAHLVLLKLLPALVLAWLTLSIALTPEQQQKLLRKKTPVKEEFPGPNRIAIALIIGGGCGNLFDRCFRSIGVVDFLDIKFYGLFGLDRWPTFNCADMAIVIGVALLILFLFVYKEKHID